MKKSIRKWTKMPPWGHYNRGYINGIMNHPDLFEVRVGVCSKDHTKNADRFTWCGISGNPPIDYYVPAKVLHTGPISMLGIYSFITLQYEDFIFDLEFANNESGFVYKVSPVTLSKFYNFTLGFYVGSQLKSKTGCVIPDDHTVHMTNHSTQTSCTIYIKSDTWKTRENIAEIDARETIYISDIDQTDAAFYEQLISDCRHAANNGAVRGSGNWGNDVVSSMMRGAGWNKIYDHVNDAFQIDVTRLWTPESCYYSFYWDNLLDSLPIALQHKESAYDQVESICSEFKDGYLHQANLEWGSSNMINPPIGSYCLLKLYQQFGDKELLQLYYPFFFETNRRLFKEKNDGQIGLISLWNPSKTDQRVYMDGVDEVLTTGSLATGLDNSPMYDDRDNFIDVGMSSIYALDCLCLSRIAEILGENTQHELMDKAYQSARDAINNFLWDEENGIYCNRKFDGTFKKVYSPTSFYPLLACDVPVSRQNRMIQEHLLNEEEFWGEYVIPSIDKRNPNFQDQNYWRGCAWAPMNFLVYEGLRNSKNYETASLLASKSLKMYEYNWKNFGWILENYNTITGSISTNCVPMYTWGILMGYIGVGELVRPCIDGIEFGNLSSKKQSIENISIGKHKVSVFEEDGLEIYSDNQLLFKTDVPTIIKVNREDPTNVFVFSQTKGTILTFEKTNTTFSSGSTPISIRQADQLFKML